MPWKVFPEGDQYCVHELNPDDSKGKKVGCHGSRSEAEAQMRALYANEKGLFGQSGDFARVVSGSPGSTVHSQPQLARVTIKEVGDQLRWIAQYSNNVRDNDRPPEILSAEGHRRFVYLVDKGYVPYPELWVWHEPSWRIGQADWMAVDEVRLDGAEYTFSVASGYFFEDAKEVGYALADVEDIAMSHGMYKQSIERDPADNSIITGFVSGELTLLPRMYAANKLTDYATVKDGEMTVNTDKRKELSKLWGVGGEILDIMESRNKEFAQKAAEMELETKESDEEDVTEEETEEVESKEENTNDDTDVAEKEEEREADTAEETEQKGVDPEVLANALVAIHQRLSAVEKATTERSEDDIMSELKSISDRLEAVEKGMEDRSPVAKQIAELFGDASVVGKDSTKVDGRSKLGKDSPTETKSEGDKLFFMDWVGNN